MGGKYQFPMFSPKGEERANKGEKHEETAKRMCQNKAANLVAAISPATSPTLIYFFS